MPNRSLWVVWTLFLCSSSWIPCGLSETTRPHDWEVKEVKEGTLYFASSGKKPLRSGLFEPKVQDELRARNGKVYLLVEGLRCRDCQANPELFLIDPTHSASGVRKKGFPTAGKLIHRARSYTIREFRVFSGRCLSRRQGDLVLWLGSEDTASGIQTKNYLLEVNKVAAGRRELRGKSPDLTRLQALVSARQCRELAGRTSQQ